MWAKWHVWQKKNQSSSLSSYKLKLTKYLKYIYMYNKIVWL